MLYGTDAMHMTFLYQFFSSVEAVSTYYVFIFSERLCTITPLQILKRFL